MITSEEKFQTETAWKKKTNIYLEFMFQKLLTSADAYYQQFCADVTAFKEYSADRCRFRPPPMQRLQYFDIGLLEYIHYYD